MYFVSLLVAAAAVSLATVGAICPTSTDKCIDKTAFSQLSQTNAITYCVNGCILVAQATACLEECKAKDSTGYLDNAKAEINAFCLKSNPSCPNVCDTYINQTKCFDPYGGRSNVTKNILDVFDTTGKRSDKDCQYLYWANSCQKLSLCSYNNDQLDKQLIRDNPAVLLGLACCGSEKAPAIAKDVEDNSKCNSDVDAKIKLDSNVACDIATATNAGDICKALEKQAANLEKNCDGCANCRRRYILPRINTYAMVNKYLGCNVKCQEVKIQPPSGSMCNYTNILNSCFYARVVDNAIDWNRLQPLLNGDLPINDICKLVTQASTILNNCIQSMLPCAVPQSKLLSQSPSYREMLTPELGGFPLDVWGLTLVLDYANDACKKNNFWTKPICTPQSLVVDVPPAETTGRPTRQQRTTGPPVKIPLVDRNQLDPDNFQKQQTDDGSKIVMSFALVSIGMIVAFFATK